MDCAEKHGMLCPEQHGFRKGSSCESQLLELVDDVSETPEKGCQEDLIVMDFSKACDKVSHNLLVHKLHRYGLTGKVNAWTECFLTDRKQAVVVNGTRSELPAVDSCVPQDSGLGHSLYLLYMNDFPTIPFARGR